MSLLVVGSIALDTIETPFDRAELVAGGSAVYISASASYFTAPIRLVGVVGSDFPKAELEFLESRGIDLAGLQIIEGGRTFHWSGRYHHDLNERDTLDTQLNVFENFNPVLPDSYRNSNYLILGNIDPVLQLRVIDSLDKKTGAYRLRYHGFLDKRKEQGASGDSKASRRFDRQRFRGEAGHLRAELSKSGEKNHEAWSADRDNQERRTWRTPVRSRHDFFGAGISTRIYL